MIRTIVLAGVTVALTCTGAYGAEESCSDLAGQLQRKCNAFCEKLDCDSVATFYTNERCVNQFDTYFRASGGQMVPCIPRYGEEQAFHANEILCYANWEVLSHEKCDPLFNRQIDKYEVIDESDGVSPYELCSMNMRAQFDVCMIGMESTALWIQCYQVYVNPCYNQYPNDQEAREACLAVVKDEVAACKAEVLDGFYFASEFPWKN